MDELSPSAAQAPALPSARPEDDEAASLELAMRLLAEEEEEASMALVRQLQGEREEEEECQCPRCRERRGEPVIDYETATQLTDVAVGLTAAAIDAIGSHKFCRGKSDDDDSCAICMSEYQTGDIIRTLPCGHKYCQKCIDPWLVEHVECPVCRKEVPGERTPVPSAGPDAARIEAQLESDLASGVISGDLIREIVTNRVPLPPHLMQLLERISARATRSGGSLSLSGGQQDLFGSRGGPAWGEGQGLPSDDPAAEWDAMSGDLYEYDASNEGSAEAYRRQRGNRGDDY